jgi:hypothetical protein
VLFFGVDGRSGRVTRKNSDSIEWKSIPTVPLFSAKRKRGFSGPLSLFNVNFA